MIERCLSTKHVPRVPWAGVLSFLTRKKKEVTMVTSISPKMSSNRPPFHPPVWL